MTEMNELDPPKITRQQLANLITAAAPRAYQRAKRDPAPYIDATDGRRYVAYAIGTLTLGEDQACCPGYCAYRGDWDLGFALAFDRGVRELVGTGQAMVLEIVDD